jgi:hypothetical protein
MTVTNNSAFVRLPNYLEPSATFRICAEPELYDRRVAEIKAIADKRQTIKKERSHEG